MKRRIAFGFLTAALVSAMGGAAQADQIHEVILNNAPTIQVALPGATMCDRSTNSIAVPVETTIASPALVETAAPAVLFPRLPAHLSIQRNGFDRFYHWF